MKWAGDEDLFANDVDLDEKLPINLVVKAGQVIGTLVIVEALASQADAQGVPSITPPCDQYVAEY